MNLRSKVSYILCKHTIDNTTDLLKTKLLNRVYMGQIVTTFNTVGTIAIKGNTNICNVDKEGLSIVQQCCYVWVIRPSNIFANIAFIHVHVSSSSTIFLN